MKPQAKPIPGMQMKAKPAPLNAPMKTTEVKPIPAPEAKPPELHVFI